MTAVQKRLHQLQTALKGAESFAARHPRALTASVVGALSCFAVTAFGIAPMAPDAAELPRRVFAAERALSSSALLTP